MSATNKAQRAASLVKALTNAQIERRGAAVADNRKLANYRTEFGTEDVTITPGAGNDRFSRSLAQQQASWATELGTTTPAL